MHAIDRRLAPRKNLAVPLQFRITNINDALMYRGLTTNLSEHGVHFTTEQTLALGAPLEMFLCVPQVLTGRRIESVRCIGRVVRVEQGFEGNGTCGVGVQIEGFEEAVVSTRWSN
jgi:PilZ domain